MYVDTVQVEMFFSALFLAFCLHVLYTCGNNHNFVTKISNIYQKVSINKSL